MRTLWGRANSSNVMKVVWLLEETGLPYHRIDAGGPFGRTRDADYLALNPNSVIPTLDEDGFVLWESNAILRYLAAGTVAGQRFYPDALQARARVEQWLDWQQTTLGPHQSALFQGIVRTAPDQRDGAAIDAALHRAASAWTILDRQLARDGYVAGPDLTLADMASGVHVHRWFSFDVARPELANLRAWYDRLLTRPAYRHHCAQPMT